MALYDRFGRLMYGSEDLIKDCLEYVVFEKHLSDTYGVWRVHDKLTPDWAPKPQPIYRTIRQPILKELPEKVEEKDSDGQKALPPQGGQGEIAAGSTQPSLATA